MPRLLLTTDELENLAVCMSYCVETQEAGEASIVEPNELPKLKRLADRLENKCNR
jgi:hypothetical protein